MTNIGLTGKTISNNLQKITVQRGGTEIITMPIIKVTNELGEKKVEFGGYRSIIHYNKDREIQYRNHKFQQKIRATNRNIRNKRLRQRGLAHNIVVSNTDVIRDHIS
jgi:hypothetical protein